MTVITDILKQFDPITLQEMDEVKFLDRMDTKFIFKFDQLPDVLKELSSKYFALKVEGTCLSIYETLYFDTSYLALYLKHHNGKLNRFKVRKRFYVTSNLGFFEIKFKNNKGRTIKKRIRDDDITANINDSSAKLLKEKTGLTVAMLHPSLWVYYKRITLINKDFTERLTIDMDLLFKNTNNIVKDYPNLVIAELKQERSARSPFAVLMHKRHIANLSISKYCLGIANIYQPVKKNNFKEKIIQLNKLCYENN
jgi:hypothetical protein